MSRCHYKDSFLELLNFIFSLIFICDNVTVGVRFLLFSLYIAENVSYLIF